MYNRKLNADNLSIPRDDNESYLFELLTSVVLSQESVIRLYKQYKQFFLYIIFFINKMNSV